jgi:hypothetical protein
MAFMNREQLREVYEYAAKRDAKIEELQRLLLGLAVTGLSIATPLLAAGGTSGCRAAWLKAALLSVSLGALSSGVRLYFGVRVAKRNVKELVRQHADGRYGDPINVPQNGTSEFQRVLHTLLRLALALLAVSVLSA